jgi:hypothetical protein
MALDRLPSEGDDQAAITHPRRRGDHRRRPQRWVEAPLGGRFGFGMVGGRDYLALKRLPGRTGVRGFVRHRAARFLRRVDYSHSRLPAESKGRRRLSRVGNSNAATHRLGAPVRGQRVSGRPSSCLGRTDAPNDVRAGRRRSRSIVSRPFLAAFRREWAPHDLYAQVSHRGGCSRPSITSVSERNKSGRSLCCGCYRSTAHQVRAAMRVPRPLVRRCNQAMGAPSGNTAQEESRCQLRWGCGLVDTDVELARRLSRRDGSSGVMTATVVFLGRAHEAVDPSTGALGRDAPSLVRVALAKKRGRDRRSASLMSVFGGPACDVEVGEAHHPSKGDLAVAFGLQRP